MSQWDPPIFIIMFTETHQAVIKLKQGQEIVYNDNDCPFKWNTSKLSKSVYVMCALSDILINGI